MMKRRKFLPFWVPRTSAAITFLAGSTLAACTARLSDPGQGEGSEFGPGTNSTGDGDNGGDGDIIGDGDHLAVDPTFAISGLRRLTTDEYTNSIRSILGETVSVPTDLELDQTADEGFEFRSVGAAHVTTSIRGVELYDAAARDLAAQVFADPVLHNSFVGCDPSAATDPCVGEYLGRAGRKIWRRPLTSVELERYGGLVGTVADIYAEADKGLEAATAALFSSPHFLYRAELGAPEGETRLLDDFELATRLSYLIWQTTPDDALLLAAAAGELINAEARQAHAARLLADPRATATLVGFFSEWLGFRDLDGVPKDATEFPDFSPELATAMRLEFEQLASRYITDDAAPWMDIFSTTDTFINAPLAAWYGVSGPTTEAFEAFSFPAEGPRGGLLTLGGFLTSNSRATMTSPTLRGLFINERLLCTHIPPPPPSVDPTLPPPPADGQLETMRQRLARHTEEPSCAGCHIPMDTPGLALEEFDATGKHRTTEFGLPIDPSGELLGEAFSDAREFGAILGASAQVEECTIRHLYRHALATHEEEGEHHVIAGMQQGASQAGGSVRALILNLVGHDGFRVVGGIR